MNKEYAQLIENDLSIDSKFYCIIEILEDGKFAISALLQHFCNAECYAREVEKSIKAKNLKRTVEIKPLEEINPMFLIRLWKANAARRLQEEQNETI